MPDINTASRIIADAEAVVGRMTRSARTALLDEWFPEAPARDLAELARRL